VATPSFSWAWAGINQKQQVSAQTIASFKALFIRSFLPRFLKKARVLKRNAIPDSNLSIDTVQNFSGKLEYSSLTTGKKAMVDYVRDTVEFIVFTGCEPLRIAQ
jgi:hypothetical protein